MSQDPVHPVLELMRSRISVERFDTSRDLDEDEIRALIDDATHAPSAFNIQHWRFVAVRRPEDKKRLQAAAYGQKQVAEAAVTFIILGDLKGVEKLREMVDLAVGCGALPQAKAEAWVRMAAELYADGQSAREEALRSATLASMLLMLAAQARGLASGALSGFDAGQVKREFGIDDRYLPVMLLAVGHPASASPTRQPRLPVDAVLAFDRGRIF